MTTELYTVFDTLTGAYGRPFHAINQADALRMAKTLANDKATTVGQSPTDFALFHLGSFDDLTAKITEFEAPKKICMFSELVVREDISMLNIQG